jgi:ATP-dependent DNA helicase RecQ
VLRKKPKITRDSVSDEDRELWEALRERRRRIAAEQGLPPYVIFHDATLMQMMEYRPTTLAAMLGLSGVGQAKLDRYGEQFLDVIRKRERSSFPAAEDADPT